MHAVHMTRREAINTKATYFYKSPLDQALQGKLVSARRRTCPDRRHHGKTQRGRG